MTRIFDIVEYPYEMKDEVIHRFPEAGLADYRIGTTIIVRQDQNVVFSIGGKILDLFGAGRHLLSTASISSIVEFLGKNFNDRTPFSADAWFVRVNTVQDCNWNTPKPLLVGSVRTGRAFIQVWGKYSFVISDPKLFLQQFGMPSDGKLKITQVKERLNDVIVPNIQKATADLCTKLNEPLLDILSYRRKEISQVGLDIVNEECHDLGITIRSIFVEGFDLAKNNNELLRAWSSAHKAEKFAAFEEVDPKFIFVISAFHKDMEPVYMSIEAAARAVGIIAKRVKDVPGDYRITDRIIEMIHKARFVIADLTHERPNVYFELGYARGIGKTVVTIAREETNVHFDVKDWTYISYQDLRTLQYELQRRFEFELSNDGF